MDQIKIGKFIAEQRKKVNLTQSRLSEKLNITDRAVSKWETGKSLPDSSIMLELCNILEITVTDLLNGEIVTTDDYDKRAEQYLIELVRQKEENDKRLLTLEVVIGFLSLTVILLPAFMAKFLPLYEWQQALIALSGFIPGLIGFYFVLKIEQQVGYYECKKCKHKYIPSFRSVIFSMHVGRTRYMTCPKCKKKSWQKKAIKKDENR